jgi:tRNA threonylcarbamoyladenosine biosynthesis protein TsaB
MSEPERSEVSGVSEADRPADRSEARGARVLALDTSTRTASVAVLGGIREVEIDRAIGSHSDDLLQLIDRALGEAGLRLGDLDGVAVGAGPGSFTGLRIAMATGKGLCFSSGLPLWPVSSLAALALDLADALVAAGEDPSDVLLVSLFDARRDECFAGFYRHRADGLVSVAADSVIPVASVGAAVAETLASTGAARAILAGDALDSHGAALAAAGELLTGARSTPSARSVGRLAIAGDRVDALRAGTPVYIRPSEAEVKFPAGNRGGHRTDKK